MGLKHSVFYEVLFPPKKSLTQVPAFSFRRSHRYHIRDHEELMKIPWVVFDLETTGFHKHTDRIIEVGAVKYLGGEEVGNYSSLVKVDIPIPKVVQKLTGISEDMLVDQRGIADVLPEFIDFLGGSLLVCHNSSFDMTMLGAELSRQNTVLEYSCLCTLKMARELLCDLPNRKLGTIAEHFGLVYETRHRSLSDARVTALVLRLMLEQRASLITWKDVLAYSHGAQGS